MKFLLALVVMLVAANLAEYAYLRDSWNRETILRADLDQALRNYKRVEDSSASLYKSFLSENDSFKKMNDMANECLERLNQCTSGWLSNQP